jgi:hypothetical protein
MHVPPFVWPPTPHLCCHCHGTTPNLRPLPAPCSLPTSCPSPSLRQPTEVHVNAVTLEVENLALLWCPWERAVTAPVPVVLWGGEAAPGVKAGGWLHLVERAVEVACRGKDVPPVIELDCKGLKVCVGGWGGVLEGGGGEPEGGWGLVVVWVHGDLLWDGRTLLQ